MGQQSGTVCKIRSFYENPLFFNKLSQTVYKSQPLTESNLHRQSEINLKFLIKNKIFCLQFTILKCMLINMKEANYAHFIG